MPSSHGDQQPGALSEELLALRHASQSRRYAAGALIFSAGDVGDGFHVVDSGRVAISAVIGQNEPRLLATIGPGDFFGEMAVLDDAPRSATAHAETDTVTLFLSRDELLAMLDRHPRLTLKLIHEFSRRMRALNRKYVEEILQAERLAVVGRFAATIVHDFKNPLTVISLASELGCGVGATAAHRARAQLSITRQIDRMSAILQELIEFTRPSGRQTALTPVSFARFLTPLAEEILLEMEPRKVAFELTGPPPDIEVHLDASRLTRLFHNLANNAADEMPDGGKIILRFIVTPGELCIEMADTGGGIAPEIAAQLFQPFATHGKEHGSGLGLTICKKIAEDHGGRIWAHSEPGHGATFCFTLPLAVEPAPARRVAKKP